MKAVKAVVLGMGAVGKSAITIRYFQHTFVENYEPTILDSYTSSLKVDNATYPIDILDTAGMDFSISLRPSYIRNRDCFILVYAIDDRQSFEEIESLYNEILRIKEKNEIPCIIIGNKCDLEEGREVSTEEARAFASKCHSKFMEVSAKTGHGVEEAFNSLLTDAIRQLYGNRPKKTWGICNLV